MDEEAKRDLDFLRRFLSSKTKQQALAYERHLAGMPPARMVATIRNLRILHDLTASEATND